MRSRENNPYPKSLDKLLLISTFHTQPSFISDTLIIYFILFLFYFPLVFFTTDHFLYSFKMLV